MRRQRARISCMCNAIACELRNGSQTCSEVVTRVPFAVRTRWGAPDHLDGLIGALEELGKTASAGRGCTANGL